MIKALKKDESSRETILPEDADAALDVMTVLTRQMLEFVLEEGKLLKEKNTMQLAAVQKGKELRAAGYARAAAEFKGRVSEFKSLSQNSIGKLEALTIQLGEVTRKNQKLIEGMASKKPLNETLVNNLFLLQGDDARAAK